MQKEKAKREPRPRPSLIKFMFGWVAIWCLVWLIEFALDAALISFQLSLDVAIYFLLRKGVFFACLSTLQMLWVRRQFRVHLRYWIPLSLLGALAGAVAFLVLDIYVLGPNLPYSYHEVWSDPLPELVRIMRLKYIADYLAHGTLLWSLPVLFQWAALRKHSRRHALWLLAAFAHNTYTISSLILFFKLPYVAEAHQRLGISWGPDVPGAAFLLDLALPSLVTGLVLYWILARGQSTDSTH